MSWELEAERPGEGAIVVLQAVLRVYIEARARLVAVGHIDPTVWNPLMVVVPAYLLPQRHPCIYVKIYLKIEIYEFEIDQTKYWCNTYNQDKYDIRTWTMR